MQSAKEAGRSVSVTPPPARRQSPLALLLFTAAVFVVATTFAVLQFRRPYVWHVPVKPLREWAWWRGPLEWNVDAALPQIRGNINSVAVSPNHKCVWIGGDAGLLYFSSDNGASWTGLKYSPADGSFTAPADNFACADNAQSTSLLKSFDLNPTVYASEGGQSSTQPNPRQSASP